MRPSAVETLRVPEPGGAPTGAEPVVQPAGRYVDLGLIAVGGMGEVRRVRDRVLDRELVMKVLRPDLSGRALLVDQFIREARLTAKLQHPNILGVHDLGRLSDGRLFFTMREAPGQTFTSLVRELHARSTAGSWATTDGGFSLRRAIDVLHKVALTVAFAHERGVVHGDLKPDNVMIGQFGEVTVLDWGLASLAELDRTRDGHGVSGTPAYMAPEQAFAEPRTPASDVYGLGATLYDLLAGHPPFPDPNPHDTLRKLRRGDQPTPLVATDERPNDPRGVDPSVPPTGPGVPAALAAIVRRAMARQPQARHPTVLALAGELADWLEGSRRAEDARALVTAALAHGGRVEELRARALDARGRGRRRLAELARSAPDTEKRQGWALVDEADALDREADQRDAEIDGMLRGALSLVPNLPEGHAALAGRLRLAHQAAEGAGDARAARRIEVGLRAHAAALPRGNPARAELATYLRGDGELTLRTAPSGAPVKVFTYLPMDRRTVASPTTALASPVVEARLAMGSYLLRIEGPAGIVAYPVVIDRCGRWDGAPPGAEESEPVPLDVGVEPDACYVPAGWTRIGGDDGPTRRVWVDGFVADRFPVTHAQYLAFLDDLVASGREAEALRHVPRERAGAEEGRPRCALDPRTRRFVPVPDDEGDVLAPDWPIVFVDWHDAGAYARWRAERTGRPWRLPSEWEWEKAARGVDGRTFPWGDHEEDTWACTLHAHAGRPMLASVHAFPIDESPYGLRGCAGNVHEWCAEARDHRLPGDGESVGLPGPADAEIRVVRGGAWNGPIRHGAANLRHGAPTASRLPFLGFRLVRSV